MHSTVKPRESVSHDAVGIAPDIVPAAWADRVLADIKRSAKSAAAPTVDTTFRATAAGAAQAPKVATIDVPNIDVPTTNVSSPEVPSVDVGSKRPAASPPSGSRMKSVVTVFLLALCSAGAAAGWQHYGGAAKRMMSAWTPFTLNSSPPTERTGLAQPDAAAIQAAAADQTPTQTAAAQAAEDAAPVPSADAAQLQTMARDLAVMAAQVEQLKASIAELKASQQAMAMVRPVETKPADTKAAAPAMQPRISTLPPRPAAAPVRRPTPAAYAPVQTAAPFPQQFSPPAARQPMPPPPGAFDTDGEPVLRPPLALH